MKKTVSKSLFSRLKGNPFLVSATVILIVAAIIRLFALPSHMSLGGDDARDIAIAKESIRLHSLPRFGSFSSAGPFVFGPLFYWVLILSYLLIPFTLFAPWIMTVIASLGMVVVMMIIGKRIGGTQLGLILGVLTAVSPQLIIRSVVVGQHTYVAIFTSLTILFLILLWQQPRKLYAFLLGVMIGIAVNMHYQALNLFVVIPFIFLIPRVRLKRKIIFIIMAIAGILAPSLPLLAWDARQEFANIRNILDYFLIAQYRLYVPNSWKLFLLSFLPSFWSYVVGGWYQLGFVAMLIAGIGAALNFIRDRSRLITCLYAIVGVFLVINRYYHGERSEGYFLYVTPLIVLITGIGISTIATWVGKSLGKQTKFIRLDYLFIFILILPFMVGGLMRVGLSNGKQQSITDIFNTVAAIKNERPGNTFALYGGHFDNYNQTTAMSAFLQDQHLESSDGMPIGVFCPGAYKKNKYPVITTLVNGCKIDDLSGDNKQSLKKKGWVLISQQSLYQDLIGHWEKEHLTSTFSLTNYVKERLIH